MLISDIATLPVGATLHHCTATNADGSALRARVNGKLQGSIDKGTWRLPMKHGLKTHFYITSSNLAEWEFSK